MHYVYLLRSVLDPARTYVGYTADLRLRLTTHNQGGSQYTARYRPWRSVTYVAFSSKPNALGFERYLKSHSGMAFASKRLW
jgi:predicted GIY-YIG superfamily endonuclease